MNKSLGNIIKKLDQSLNKWTKAELRELLAAAENEIIEWQRVCAEVIKELRERK